MNGRNKKKLINASKEIKNSYPLAGDLVIKIIVRIFLKIKKGF